MSDELYNKLKGAREKLCVSQTLLSPLLNKYHRRLLGEAIDRIDRVGVYYCPQWSRFDQPHIEDPTPEIG